MPHSGLQSTVQLALHFGGVNATPGFLLNGWRKLFFHFDGMARAQLMNTLSAYCYCAAYYRSKGAGVSEAGAMPPKRQAGAGRNSSGQAETQLCLQGIQPEDGKTPDGRDACAGADLSGGAER